MREEPLFSCYTLSLAALLYHLASVILHLRPYKIALHPMVNSLGLGLGVLFFFVCEWVLQIRFKD